MSAVTHNLHDETKASLDESRIFAEIDDVLKVVKSFDTRPISIETSQETMACDQALVEDPTTCSSNVNVTSPFVPIESPSSTEHMRLLAIAYLIGMTKTHPTFSWEQHFFLVRNMASFLHRISVKTNKAWIQARPSWLAGFHKKEGPHAKKMSKQTKLIAQKQVQYDVQGSFSSFFSGSILNWSDKTPFVKMAVCEEHALQIQLNQMMLLSSCLDENALIPHEWALFSWPFEPSKCPVSFLQNIMDKIALYLAQPVQIGSALFVGLPYMNDFGKIQQDVLVNTVTMHVQFDTMSEWQAYSKKQFQLDPSKVQVALDSIMESLNLIVQVSPRHESPCASPFSEKQYPSPCLESVSPHDMENFSILAAKIVSRQEKLVWPFWVTRKSPIIIFRKEDKYMAMVHWPSKNFQAYSFAPGMEQVHIFRNSSIHEAMDVSSRKINSWMLDIYMKNKPAESSFLDLYDCYASASRTHTLWREMFGLSQPPVDHECQFDMDCRIGK